MANPCKFICSKTDANDTNVWWRMGKTWINKWTTEVEHEHWALVHCLVACAMLIIYFVFFGGIFPAILMYHRHTAATLSPSLSLFDSKNNTAKLCKCTSVALSGAAAEARRKTRKTTNSHTTPLTSVSSVGWAQPDFRVSFCRHHSVECELAGLGVRAKWRTLLIPGISNICIWM